MAADYESLLKVIANPAQFPKDCVELDYIWDGSHVLVTLRWRHNTDEDWLYCDMLPLPVGHA
jgi:hypothetical protein